MILNMDDMRYSLIGVSTSSKKILKHTTVEGAFADENLGCWIMDMLHTCITCSRLLETEHFLDTTCVYFLFVDERETMYNWPEMEEKIRRHIVYRSMYEEKSKFKI